mgnify:CR=1 FL=1
MVLCGDGRSYRDYTELALKFHSVFISNVDRMGLDGLGDEMAKRFVSCIDAFYDRNVKLIITASQPIEELYCKGRLCFEFKRCFSRLHEMQSSYYLSLEHLTD